MHSISDLTTFCRKTTGDVPPRLVGASTTVVGSKVYLFGGRLVTERRTVSDLYVFDLETFVWKRIDPFEDDDIPEPRYFHSAETWNNQLIIFGGMGNVPNSTSVEDLCVLNDIRFFDLLTMHWLPALSTNGIPCDSGSEALLPKPRYAHLSSVTADRLFIIGGQDLSNIWLDDVYVYDLLGKVWVQRRSFPHHCGTYRSVAVSANQRFRIPQNELRNSDASASSGSPGSRFRSDKLSPSSESTPSESLIHLPFSAAPTDDFPNDIYLYSNYNFTDVKRELQVFSPLPDTDFTITEQSSSMNGSAFPPGLRFPSGAILGTHFIIAGTYLAHTYQSYSIWALDLLTMAWSRIDPGNALAAGSWFRACLWAETNKLVIFGNRNGNLVEDYNRRLLSWDHVAVIDLESFGIYQPPPLRLDIPMQELGLSALEEGILADFEILCDDGRKIKCSRRVLEDRWPWFKDQRIKFLERAKRAVETLPSSSMDVGLPDLPGAPHSPEARPDPRLTPRAFNLSEQYPVTLALLQYFYSLALITPLQHAPAVLSQLLILSSTYQISHLQSLVKHAMHRALSNSTAVGVYEVATLCSCRSLQIRALKTVMAYSQRRTERSRADSRGGGTGGSRNPDQGDGEHQGRGSDDALGSPNRARGTSDVRFPGNVDQQSTALNSRGHVGNQTAAEASRRVSDKAGSIKLRSKTGQPSHKATSSQSTLTPPRRRRTMSSRRPRSPSIVSVHTDLELCAVADLLSPSVIHTPSSDEQVFNEVALDDGCDDYLDADINPLVRAVRNTTFRSHILLEHEEPLSPPFDAGFPYSISGQSESEQDSDDIYPLPRSPAYCNLPNRARARARSNTGVSASDSDTPSLLSSTSFSSASSVTYSQPHSPATLKTPVDHVPLYQPTVREERSPVTDEERDARRLSQSSGSIIFAPIDVPSDPEKFVRMPKAVEPRASTKPRNVERLRLNVPPPPTHFFPTMSPVLPAGGGPESRAPLSTLSSLSSLSRSSNSSESTTPTPSTRTLKLSLNKFVSPASKPRKMSLSHQVAAESSSSPTSVATGKDSKNEDPKEIKSRKAEAKRMKKAEEKARMERLAEELKERQRRKMLAMDKRSIHSSGGRSRRHWDDDRAMYDGLGAGTVL
ncbi:hypothetical protein BKA82DRAFT_1004565 [Pisolithus tinctorius]|uniref:BTB domain-containing protein n=1 Tax=Pisolithus tinctorius Marx 270 TaxID=870435 RepID=A0A0C3IRS4_PISTI|nr:hypothetical protein BKA82DRAFT_1004565 [Pisolithus tinctorius]KIN99622.1 hypothetical protein M404DRAFT_1004565 [Pisolithus tinctorius Marx 270]